MLENEARDGTGLIGREGVGVGPFDKGVLVLTIDQRHSREMEPAKKRSGWEWR